MKMVLSEGGKDRKSKKKKRKKENSVTIFEG